MRALTEQVFLELLIWGDANLVQLSDTLLSILAVRGGELVNSLFREYLK